MDAIIAIFSLIGSLFELLTSWPGAGGPSLPKQEYTKERQIQEPKGLKE